MHAGRVYSPGNPDAQSFVVHNGQFVWIGDRVAARTYEVDVDRIVDLQEAFVAPAFVDAHAHVSATGFQLTQLDLSACDSASQALEALRTYCASAPESVEHILGTGWDDARWQDADLWTTERLTHIIGNRFLYLSRIDLHSAFCSVNLADSFEGNPYAIQRISGDEHERVRERMLATITPQQRARAIESALSHAASKGIVAVHEHGGPGIAGEGDFTQLLKSASNPHSVQVFGYWGSSNLDEVRALGAFGAGGDLCVDGSLGSHTALLAEPYQDARGYGVCYLDENGIAQHLIEATQAGIQTGFHAIGDKALGLVVAGLQKAAMVCGDSAIRAMRHRVEHAELVSTADLPELARLGVVLSMQPSFDAIWGGVGGMYEQRLGRERSLHMNPFAEVSTHGIVMAFGSDSPVTLMNPWQSIQAATFHHNPNQRISARAAFAAHTRGGWRAVHDDVAGVIAVGAPAHFVAWNVEHYTIDVPDQRKVAWSVDPRSGTPELPDVRQEVPQAILTVRAGNALYDPQKVWTGA